MLQDGIVAIRDETLLEQRENVHGRNEPSASKILRMISVNQNTADLHVHVGNILFILARTSASMFVEDYCCCKTRDVVY